MSAHDDSDAAKPSAPGAHGWPQAAKSAVGTAAGPASRVWFTVAEGVVSEIFYPGPDRACLRELRFIVTGQDGWFSDEGDTIHECAWLEPGIPAFRQSNTCDRYRLEKTIFTDPERDALILQVRFTPLAGRLGDYRLHCILAPYLSEKAEADEAWAGAENGVELLLAAAPGKAVALVCNGRWKNRCLGAAGDFDPVGDLRKDGRLPQCSEHFRGGPLLLAGEIDLSAHEGRFDLVAGFGACAAAAALQARCGLRQDLGQVLAAYQEGWKAWQSTLRRLDEAGPDDGTLFRCSAAVLRVHHGKDFPGAAVASLSIPWGPTKTNPNEAAYHLLWTRDLVEIGGALLAVGDHCSARRSIQYLQGTQRSDGHWAQNMWLDGTAHWKGIQLDETALPILLVELAWREGALDEAEVRRLWPMIRKAADFVARSGPGSEEDRWEQNAGIATSTVAAAVAGLIAAARMADLAGEALVAASFRDTADSWNAGIEITNYVAGTDLARACGVDGYYFWIRPFGDQVTTEHPAPMIRLAHHLEGENVKPAFEVVSPDALMLVRFGLRSANDPRIRDTIKVVDRLLRRETPLGPAWRRYAGDAYGENADGSPFGKTGIGRAWPLLTGERAHYELAAGRPELARELAGVMRNFAGRFHLLPEQVWDEPDLPEKGLRNGEATGSARPLVWAHAEYLKLLRSLADGRVFDAPPCVCERYLQHADQG